MRVFVVIQTNPIDWDAPEEVKVIGVYSTPDAAMTAINAPKPEHATRYMLESVLER